MEETIPSKNLHSREYKKKVHLVAWNFSGTKLASGSVDQTARVCQIEPHRHGKVKDVELKGHTDSVWISSQAELSGENINVTYKPDGTHIAVGNRDDELTILDVRKFKPIHKCKFNYETSLYSLSCLCQLPIFMVNEIAWNMVGDMFFLTTGNGTVVVLAYPSIKPVDTLMAHTAGCYCIAIDPTKRYFVDGSADSLVSLWDISEMLCVRTFTKLDVEWNPKHNLLAYAGDDKNKYQADKGVFRIFGIENAA
ncbi:hypothetical protein UlMin_003331 [Ulmus minor]